LGEVLTTPSRENIHVMKYSCMGEERGVHRVLVRERGRWGDPDVDGRIILRWM
jgi:hypothetical protein